MGEKRNADRGLMRKAKEKYSMKTTEWKNNNTKADISEERWEGGNRIVLAQDGAQ
jgi:hypothetical protein